MALFYQVTVFRSTIPCAGWIERYVQLIPRSRERRHPCLGAASEYVLVPYKNSGL